MTHPAIRLVFTDAFTYSDIEPQLVPPFVGPWLDPEADVLVVFGEVPVGFVLVATKDNMEPFLRAG